MCVREREREREREGGEKTKRREAKPPRDVITQLRDLTAVAPLSLARSADTTGTDG